LQANNLFPYACLDSSFRFTGKHSLAFLLAWIPFPLYRQAFSRFSACLDSSFSYQASILSLFRLPGLLFFFSGKHSPAFPFAWISLLAFRQSVVP
jgi:hypothetical protein